MLSFLGFIIILCLATTGFTIFYFDTKVREAKRQVLSLNNQLLKFKSSSQATTTNLSQQSMVPNEVTITYITPNFKYGVTQPYTAVYLAPISNSYIINKIKDKINFEIITEADINKEVWFFVQLDMSTNVNSKGWIRKSQVSMFIDDSSDSTKMSYR